MPRRLSPVLLFACLPLALAATGTTSAPAPQPAPAAEGRVAADRQGDPPPPGAFARLGAARFRHGAGVFTVTFAPRGKAVFSLGTDGSLRCWDLATGKDVTPAGLRRAPLAAFAVGRSADRRPLLATAEKHAVHIRDAATGKALRQLPTGGQAPYALAFTPDGRLLAAPWSASSVRLWDTRTGKAVRDLACGGYATSLQFSPDGRRLAVASGRQAEVRAVATGERVCRFPALGSLVRWVAFAPGGKLLSAGLEQPAVFLGDVATGKYTRGFVEGPATVTSLALAPDGKTLAAGYNDGLIRLWNVTTGKVRHRFGEPSVEVVALAFSPDGKTLAAGQGVAVRLWEVLTGEERSPAPGHLEPVRVLAVSPDGKQAATGALDGRVVLWDLKTGKELRRLRDPDGCGRWLAFSADGKSLISGARLPKVRFWDLTRAGALHTLEEPKGVSWGPLAISPDGKTLAVGNQSTLLLYDPGTGKGQRFGGHGQSLVWQVAFSPDGRRVASLGSDGTMIVRATDTGKLIRRFPCGVSRTGGTGEWDYAAYPLSFSPDGRRLLLLDQQRGGGVQLWEVVSGGLCHEWRGEGVNLEARFSPGGRVIAVRNEGEAVRLLDAATGRAFARLGAPSKRMGGLAFSPDGKVLLSGQADGTVVLWRVPAADLGRSLRHGAEGGPR
jgi:WD40 repeat protein